MTARTAYRFLAFPLLGFALGQLGCSPTRDVPTEAFERARSRGSTPDREWRTYLGDRAVSHASPLSEIHRDNVARLESTWRYDAGEASDRGGSQIQFNPLVVKGVLYGVSPSFRLFALDAATGEELWSFRPESTPRGFDLPRGAVYFEDGDDERLIYGVGSYLHAVDPRTGQLIEDFGEDGRIDLGAGFDREISQAPAATTPGILFEDLLIVGGRVSEFAGAAPGDVRAYDVRTGEIRWTFHTIPRPGEFGHDTWPPEAWQRFGGANNWAGMSVDTERGLVFIPTGSAAFDFFGGDRPGDNLFANTLLALDARTGERRWHQQLVRHDVWDRDLPSPPNLVEIERDGERIPAVAQTTKTGHVFVFHRETGEPLFPIEEVPVEGPGVPHERLAASQPLPTRPPPFVRQRFEPTDRTPEASAFVTSTTAGMRAGALYTAGSVEGTILLPGLDGGAEWGGAAWDAETGLLYVNANEVPWKLQLARVPADRQMMSLEFGYAMTCSGCHGMDRRGDGVSVPSLVGVSDRLGFLEIYGIVRDGRGRMSGLANVARWYEIAALTWYVYSAEDDASVAIPVDTDEGGAVQYTNAGFQKLYDHEQLPASKPPWGTLTAIDLGRGEFAWRRPLGDYAAVLEDGRSGLGAENYGGPVVTAGGLLFLAGTPDAKLRAFDKATGEILWEADLPADGFATPAVYEADGREFVVVAAGGGKLGRPSGGHYVAFALPEDAR